MLNLKQMGYDYSRIIDTFSRIGSAEQRLSKLDDDCRLVEENLEKYRNYEVMARRQWGISQKAIQDYGTAMQMGLKLDHILGACAIFSKHNGEFTIDQVINDIETYGSLRSAIFRLSREIDRMNIPTGCQTQDKWA